MTATKPAPATPTMTELQRAAAYDLLALALAYPDEATAEQLRELAEETRELLDGTAMEPLRTAAARAGAAELEPAHARLFTMTSSVDCPSYESAYVKGEPQLQTARMADIAGFYRAFGVEPAGSGFRPDEISVELAFMAYLCRKELHARTAMGAPRVAQVRRAARLFLQDHLGTWAPAFGRRVAAQAGVAFYQLAGTALAVWVTGECARLGARPVEVSGQPMIEPLDRSSHGPEFAGAAPSVFAFDDIPVA